MARVDRQVDRAGPRRGALQHLLPGLAAVAGAEHPALAAGRVKLADGRDVDGVGILRVHHDPRDPIGIGQARELECAAAVVAAVNTHAAIR